MMEMVDHLAMDAFNVLAMVHEAVRLAANRSNSLEDADMEGAPFHEPHGDGAMERKPRKKKMIW